LCSAPRTPSARLLGLLLAALAIQTMAEGLRELFPGLKA
jgi:small neutral amino acid transporter SnatA (MarC family)